MTSHPLQELVELGRQPSYPAEAIEAVKVILVHDLSVALSARPLVAHLLEEAYSDGGATDLMSGRRVDLPSAVSRNGQLVHALTQDDTHLPAMTHVGATSIPLLLALGEAGDRRLSDLLSGFVAAYAIAEFLGLPVAAQLAGKGVRPTPMIGPIAAVVAAGRMEGWGEERLQRAIGRVAAVAMGTTQAWVDGSHEWLFEISAAGQLALSAARSSAKEWRAARDPLWGPAGLFRCFGLTPPARGRNADVATAALRANVKRFPACAINQVPMVLLQEAMKTEPLSDRTEINLRLSPPEANYPGIGRYAGLDTWSARLMSLPYCMTVMAQNSDFKVGDLEATPRGLSEEQFRRVRVQADSKLAAGQYVVEIAEGSRRRVLEGSLDGVGRPARKELEFAARKVIGDEGLASLLALTDKEDTSVRDFASAVVRAGATSH